MTIRRPWGGRRNRLATFVTAAGVVLVLAGIGVLVPPLLGVWQRGNHDHQLLQKWLGNQGAITKVLPSEVVAPAGSSSPPAAAACGSGSPSSEYLLVAFPTLPGIEGVAGNGSWALLTQRSVVHYSSSPGPGQEGNMLIALHREPNFEPLGSLRVGDPIVITDRACTKFTYTVTQVWVESPSKVSQLGQLSGGKYLTLITCTPLWVDTQRIVIRAELTSSTPTT